MIKACYNNKNKRIHKNSFRFYMKTSILGKRGKGQMFSFSLCIIKRVGKAWPGTFIKLERNYARDGPFWFSYCFLEYQTCLSGFKIYAIWCYTYMNKHIYNDNNLFTALRLKENTKIWKFLSGIKQQEGNTVSLQVI